MPVFDSESSFHQTIKQLLHETVTLLHHALLLSSFLVLSKHLNRGIKPFVLPLRNNSLLQIFVHKNWSRGGSRLPACFVVLSDRSRQS